MLASLGRRDHKRYVDPSLRLFDCGDKTHITYQRHVSASQHRFVETFLELMASLSRVTAVQYLIQYMKDAVVEIDGPGVPPEIGVIISR